MRRTKCLVSVATCIASLCLIAPSTFAKTLRIPYLNSGPKPTYVEIELPGNSRVATAHIRVTAHAGGEAPYPLTAITLEINGTRLNPETHRIAPSQIRGRGTLAARGSGETKTFDWDLASLVVANPDRSGTGSVTVDARRYFHPGSNRVALYTSVGTDSWVKGEIVLALAGPGPTINVDYDHGLGGFVDVTATYVNPGPSANPARIDLPMGPVVPGGPPRQLAGSLRCTVHAGGEAPYTLTAVTVQINGHAVNPDTHRIAPSQIRGPGTLRAVGAGETKTFDWDLERVTVANPDRHGTGSVVVNLLRWFHPGTNTFSVHTSVGTASWARCRLVFSIRPQ